MRYLKKDVIIFPHCLNHVLRELNQRDDIFGCDSLPALLHFELNGQSHGHVNHELDQVGSFLQDELHVLFKVTLQVTPHSHQVSQDQTQGFHLQLLTSLVRYLWNQFFQLFILLNFIQLNGLFFASELHVHKFKTIG